MLSFLNRLIGYGFVAVLQDSFVYLALHFGNDPVEVQLFKDFIHLLPLLLIDVPLQYFCIFAYYLSHMADN